jgi:uncharacterized protein (DUF2141 family)
MPQPAAAAELVVRVSGIQSARGQIGCGLHAASAGFPMDDAQARQLWLPADPKGVECRYADLPEGVYAVSVMHDLNGNRKVDANLFGIPTEPWGVSNNARPNLRAPRWDEARFKLDAQPAVQSIDVRVAP